MSLPLTELVYEPPVVVTDTVGLKALYPLLHTHPVT
jgi:hypothetical protein